ncbi:MAG: hypothetical protein FJ161_01330 [Gammaproteobacteria bacterium]|nr:hypothetical protein [Gammaproteobacteria bacterium]
MKLLTGLQSIAKKSSEIFFGLIIAWLIDFGNWIFFLALIGPIYRKCIFFGAGFLIGHCIYFFSIFIIPDILFDHQVHCVESRCQIEDNMIEKILLKQCYITPVKKDWTERTFLIHETPQVSLEKNLIGWHIPRYRFYTTFPIEDTHSRPTIKRTRLASYDFFQAFCFGNIEQFNQIGEIFRSFGLQHLLCFSGWHVQKIREKFQRYPYLYHIIMLIYIGILMLPFPLSVAYLKSTLNEKIPDRRACWSISILCILFIQPFAWMSLSFWLTCYYIVLIEELKIDQYSLMLSSLGWMFCLNQEWAPICWIIGRIIEPWIILLFIVAPFLYIYQWYDLIATDMICHLITEGLAMLRISTFFLPTYYPIGIILLCYPLIKNELKNYQGLRSHIKITPSHP